MSTDESGDDETPAVQNKSEFDHEGDLAVSTNSQQMLMCMVRWAIFRDIQYGDHASDPWLKHSWRGGEVMAFFMFSVCLSYLISFTHTAISLILGVEIPEILMTHEEERSEDDMRVIRATAVFVHKLVQRHGKRKGEAMAVSQEEVENLHGTCITFYFSSVD